LKSKPTWSNAPGCSTTSAFFVLVGRRGPDTDIKFLHGEYAIGDFHRTFACGPAAYADPSPQAGYPRFAMRVADALRTAVYCERPVAVEEDAE
jgi:hypothetical protein